MPIFDLGVGRRAAGGVGPGLASRLADALGQALGAARGKVWVRLRTLAPEAYAENGEGDGRASPVFVTMTASAPPEGDALDRLVAQVTQAVAGQAGRPAENVHVVLQPAAKGRIAFGGKVVR